MVPEARLQPYGMDFPGNMQQNYFPFRQLV